MISPEELAAVPLLATVPPGDLARLAQAAGDLRLSAGDSAVNEGDERSLFVVLSGNIEVVKRVDGLEKVIGQRHPGQIFGEVPITFGTPFQVSARDFHVLAAAHPAVLTHVAALASERIGGLCGIATAPPKTRAVMLGQPGDDRVRELRVFLTRNQISHDWVRADAETDWLPDAILRDSRGYVRTGETVAGSWPLDRDPYLLETSVPGIFACGDVRASPVKRVAAAVGEGSMAIAFVHQFLAHAASR